MVSQVGTSSSDARAANAERAQQWQDAWSGFMAFVDRHQQSYWIFRGVADAATHQLLPKVGRPPARYNKDKERIIFANFRRRARQFIDTSRMTQWDLLALAQHHGLPTRLLDWTTNPLVAAYFAVSSQSADTAARVYAARAPGVIDVENAMEPFDVSEISAFIPSAVTVRIVSQKGLFTVHPNPTQPWDRGLRTTGGSTGRPHERHFDIAAQFRPYFERRLFYLGVDAAAIKSDLDGLCETLAWQFRREIAVGKFNY